MRRVAVVLAIAVSIALVYWPGLYGFWTRDDYMQLAFARLIGAPWSVFFHDHYFPVPGSIFRPLGFASFWLSQALFGTDYFWNAFGDLALHVAVSLALYRVIRAGAIDRGPAVLCTLLFALHPAVLGTALWWSARCAPRSTTLRGRGPDRCSSHSRPCSQRFCRKRPRSRPPPRWGSSGC